MAENYWQQLLICFETLMEESIKLGYDLSSQMFIMNLKEDRGSFDFRDHLTNIAIAIIKKVKPPNKLEIKTILKYYIKLQHMHLQVMN